MGHSSKKKVQSSRIQLRWLRSGIVTSLLTMGVSRIYSHQ